MELTLKESKIGCTICSSWTALHGCKHKGPQDYSKNKEIIDAIVAAAHGGNREIVETSDFYAGINAALICLRQNNLLKP